MVRSKAVPESVCPRAVALVLGQAASKNQMMVKRGSPVDIVVASRAIGEWPSRVRAHVAIKSLDLMLRGVGCAKARQSAQTTVDRLESRGSLVQDRNVYLETGVLSVISPTIEIISFLPRGGMK